MVEVLFVTTQRRVQATRLDETPPAAAVVPRVVAKVGIPGREGPPGPAGTNSDGSPPDPGDLTLIFANKLI